MAQAIDLYEEESGGGIGETLGRFVKWFRTSGPWWLVSLAGHMVVFLVLGLVLGTVEMAKQVLDAPLFETEMDTLAPEQVLERFEVGETTLEVSELTTDSLSMLEAPEVAQDEANYSDSETFVDEGGGVGASDASSVLAFGNLDLSGMNEGPKTKGKGSGGLGGGVSDQPGTGGHGIGFGGRGEGQRKAQTGSFGGTKQTERAVAAALNWFARHQNKEDGSWSLNAYNSKGRCQDATCTGLGSANADAAATAFALLPFLAAGQTHRTKGPYQNTIARGLYWLAKNQKADGDLSAGGGPRMYVHGLAAIALCEAYGLSKDAKIGASAQAAIRFIEKAQNPQTGGWHYEPLGTGDTSVVGWQIMALKSGQMVKLKVNPATFEGGRKFLKSCSSGAAGGLFGYTPGGGGTPTMTAVGLLCYQYMGARRTDPAMVEGTNYLMQNLPPDSRNYYYWYYGTQVMHNLPGKQWDTWNRRTRKALISTQVKDDSCAAGSWDPAKPSADPWGGAGGRIMQTSMACLSLEVYYRYSPLFKLDAASGLAGEKVAAKGK